MLKTKEGDLLVNVKAPAIIVHGCNAQGKMRSGFADKLRNKYPEAYTVYKKYFNEVGLKVGDVNIVQTHTGMIIANAVTQEFYGRNPDVVYVNYAAVEKVLTEAAEFSEQNHIPVHMPFIGGGLANGDRNKLLEIFTRVFANTDATLWII